MFTLVSTGLRSYPTQAAVLGAATSQSTLSSHLLYNKYLGLRTLMSMHIPKGHLATLRRALSGLLLPCHSPWFTLTQAVCSMRGCARSLHILACPIKANIRYG
jgi:hypothetical protein